MSGAHQSRKVRRLRSRRCQVTGTPFRHLARHHGVHLESRVPQGRRGIAGRAPGSHHVIDQHQASALRHLGQFAGDKVARVGQGLQPVESAPVAMGSSRQQIGPHASAQFVGQFLGQGQRHLIVRAARRWHRHEDQRPARLTNTRFRFTQAGLRLTDRRGRHRPGHKRLGLGPRSADGMLVAQLVRPAAWPGPGPRQVEVDHRG